MKITSKGQVTIPIDVRERLGLHPETEVQFEIEGNAVRVRKVRDRPGRGAALVGRMKGRATRRMTTDQILALTRR